ncbi:MAG: hypothetical protein E2P02_29040 [Acidobacteria bacterium]|nr:MAG: hypothetical protein E2P02_29040 [Acidobacteriota bacterium]
MILGTAAYMSPEQAKGKRVDKRTDIWAFGAVVYEMLTGKRAFAGEDVSDTLAAVLRAEPDFDALPSETPGTVLRILQLCLTKDPNERARDIGDVRLAMKGAFETRAEVASPPVGWRPSIAMAAAAALLLSVVTGVSVWQVHPAPTPRAVARFSVPLPPGDFLTRISRSTGRRLVALSSDGTRLVYSANDRLYLRAMEQMEATPVRGTEGARSPFFSPDGEWIVFYSDSQLKKVAVRGGAPIALCDADPPLGLRWQANGNIVFGQRAGILRVSEDGGEPELLVAVDGTGEVAHGP